MPVQKSVTPQALHRCKCRALPAFKSWLSSFMTSEQMIVGVSNETITSLQVTSSFKALVARNPDLCLNFIKEVSLCLSIPCLPETPDPDGNLLKEESESEAMEPSLAASHTPAPSQVPSLGEHIALVFLAFFPHSLQLDKIAVQSLGGDISAICSSPLLSPFGFE